MSRPCDELHVFADGELPPERAASFRDHLAGCAACQRELLDVMQLGALTTGLSPSATATETETARDTVRPSAVASLAWYRRRRTALVVAIPAMAAAAALILVPRRGPVDRASLGSPVAIALAEHRSIEGRVADPRADRYRPYDVARASEVATGETISLRTLAELEERGELEVVAEAYLLMGDATKAASYLERATSSPSADSDRALVLLAQGKPEEALVAVDRALATRPDHPQATWNRALVLRELGLLAVAAEAFDRAAVVGGQGWSDEARRRAAALRGQLGEREAVWKAVESRGIALTQTGSGLTVEDAARFPGVSRLYFYDAVRAAPSRERVLALMPLAVELDRQSGGGVLAGYLARIARSDFAVRAAFAEVYRGLIAGQVLEPAAIKRLLDGLAAAHLDDILLGSLLRTGRMRTVVDPERLADYRRLAARARDPWFELIATEQEAVHLRSIGDYAAAEVKLVAGLARCSAARLDYRCARIDNLLGDIYQVLHRTTEARNRAMAGWDRARRAGEWYAELGFLPLLADIAQLRDVDAGSVGLSRAYLEESLLRSQASRPDDVCGFRARIHESMAMLMVHQQKLADARREMDQARTLVEASCKDRVASQSGAFVLAHLLRSAGDAADVARVRSDLAAMRSDPSLPPGDRAFLDHIEGRLLIERDPAAGQAFLRGAIAAVAGSPTDDVDATKTWTYSYSVLVLDAGRRGDFAAALDDLGAELRVPPAGRCVLGLAEEDGAALAIARGVDGSMVGHYGSGQPGVPAEVGRALVGCDVVDVLAAAPIQGRPGLIDRSIAWRYRSGAAVPATPSGPPRRLVIADVEPPATLGLPRLSSHAPTAGAVELRGPAATPSRVLREMVDASEIEIHAHGLVNLGLSDASFLAVSPDTDGRYAITAGDIRKLRLGRAPVVILGACQAAKTASYFHQPWSLATAFIAAGARAVIASPAPIRDAHAAAFFAAVERRIEAGASAAAALRDERLGWSDRSDDRWLDQLIVFE